MLACEAATGIPKAIQQAAKREGCTAFDSHSRVNLEILLRFLFGRDASGEDTNWVLRLKRAQALTAEMELELAKGDLVPIAEVYAQQDQAVAKARAVMTQKFHTELPPKQDGMPAEKIAELNRKALDDVLTILSKRETYL